MTMTKLLILFSLFFAANSNADIVRKEIPISSTQIQEIKKDINASRAKHSKFNDTTAERLRVFSEQGLKEQNSSLNGQFADIRIPLVWYVHSF